MIEYISTWGRETSLPCKRIINNLCRPPPSRRENGCLPCSGAAHNDTLSVAIGQPRAAIQPSSQINTNIHQLTHTNTHKHTLTHANTHTLVTQTCTLRHAHMHPFMHTGKSPKCMHWWAAPIQELSVFSYFLKRIRCIRSLRSSITSEPGLPLSIRVVHILKCNQPGAAALCCTTGYQASPALII